MYSGGAVKEPVAYTHYGVEQVQGGKLSDCLLDHRNIILGTESRLRAPIPRGSGHMVENVGSRQPRSSLKCVTDHIIGFVFDRRYARHELHPGDGGSAKSTSDPPESHILCFSQQFHMRLATFAI